MFTTSYPSSGWAAALLLACFGFAPGTYAKELEACHDQVAFTPAAQKFLGLAAESVIPIERRADLAELHARARCGDARALNTLRIQVDRAETRLFATAALFDASIAGGLDLIRAIGQSTGLEMRAQLLDAASEWLLSDNEVIDADEIVRETAWAHYSGDQVLARAALDLRAMHGDPASIATRAELLMACATESDGSTGHDCLGRHELHSARLAEITSRWNSATAQEKIWLARWSRKLDANQRFFLDHILQEDPQVQYQILIEPLGSGGETPVHAIDAALALLRQSVEQPERRPAPVKIDFNADYREGLFGVVAYEPHSYPMALQQAFDELVTFPDAGVLMSELAALDNPWLATHAGIWLVRHAQADAANGVLRFTLEADGLPARSVLRQLVPVEDTISAQARNVFVTAVKQGDLGKWNALATNPFEALLDEQVVLEALIARVATLPERAARAGIDLTCDAGLAKRLEKTRLLRDEMRAVQWAAEGQRRRPEFLDAYINAFAALDGEIWQGFSMAMLYHTGGLERARMLAMTLVNSESPELRAKAKKVLEKAQ